MKKKLLFVFIISLLSVSYGFAQENKLKPVDSLTKKDKIKEIPSEKLEGISPDKIYYQHYGLRIGADISRPIRSLLDKSYQGLELVGDYRLNYRYYLAGEIGKERKVSENNYFDFTTNGQYIKFGIDYNSYTNWYGMENMIYVGARYGISLFSQDLTSYIIHKDNQYWNETITGSDPSFLKKYDGRTAHWLELVLGIKAELLHNLYAGASVRVGLLVAQTGSSGFPNYYIPAFGRVYEGSRFGVNFNYTLSYLIPLYKKEKKKEETDTQKTNSSPTPSAPAKKPKGRR